ncbi:MAG TPA: HNH endonuclease [Desulfosarcina sp.]|nr:HNH endonuclease [Desulfosarcina sp.]
MALTKLELQQMLREMNVKFHADETYDELKQRLQQEHHSLWLKSVSGDAGRGGGAPKKVIRKRRKPPLSQDAVPDPSRAHPANAKPSSASRAVRSREPAYRRRPIEKPEPGKPWKAAAAGTEPFNRKRNVFASVLKRADMCCERCQKPYDEASAASGLQPFHIEPLSAGGEHTIKNVVALCPNCLESMQTDPDPKDIKALKRKTRSKLYDALEVVRRKTGHRRKGGARKSR